jgi:DNA polymerase elongation subunit (family B)
MIDIEQKNSVLSISYFDENGEVAIDKIVVPSEELFEWEYCAEKDGHPVFKSWDEKPVKKVKTRFLSKWRMEEFLLSLPPERTANIYSMNVPKKFFVDIEVFVGDEWPKPEQAKTPVTAITFCHEDRVISMGTKQLTSQQISNIKKKIQEHIGKSVDFNYLYFKSEFDMLSSFFLKAMQKMPVITGWNFIGFDWTYLINRCKRLNIDISDSSPTKKLSGELMMPVHRLVVDYLDVYRKWDRIIDMKENNTLDYVAKAALGINKIKYPGTLQDMYESDFETYIFYNAVDTKLVEMIDKKLNTLQTFLTLGGIAQVEANRAFSPIWMTEAAMTRELYRRNRVFPKTEKLSRKRESYEGAFVVEPKTGIYEWVASFDFASLYPSIMRQWNISPESYLHNVDALEEIDVNTYIKTSSGAVFRKDKDSVFRTILTDFYAKRKSSKKIYMEIEEEIEALKKYIDHSK